MITNIRYTDGDKQTVTAMLDGREWVGIRLDADSDGEIPDQVKAWIAAGNTPSAYAAPVPTDPMDAWDILTLKIAFHHENRIRALESKAPITLAQFKAALKAL